MKGGGKGKRRLRRGKKKEAGKAGVKRETGMKIKLKYYMWDGEEKRRRDD